MWASTLPWVFELIEIIRAIYDFDSKLNQAALQGEAARMRDMSVPSRAAFSCVELLASCLCISLLLHLCEGNMHPDKFVS